MADDALTTTVSNDHFEAVLAELLQAEERGEQPDWPRVRQTWPELEAPLREFFRDRDHFARLAPHLASATPGTPPAPPDLPPGSRFGGYEIVREVGRGGRGVVYRVSDPELNRSLAVKVLRPELHKQTDAVQRFLEEAQVTGQLQHPGIVPVHAIGQLHDGRPYFAMKLVQGRTLAELLAGRPTPSHDLPRFLGVFQQVSQAVAYAHTRSVIHRDLKPANVMVGEFGEVQVMDWGLAKVLASRGPQPPQEGAPTSTICTVRTEATGLSSADGMVVGTFAYMSPEQAKGQVEQLDPRADVFGLGAVLCEVLTGLPPYAGAPAWKLHLTAAAGDLAEAFTRLDRCGADAELIALAKNCLAPERKGRLRDAGAATERMAAYLAAVQERLRRAELEKAAAQARAREERRRRRWQAAAAALVILALLAAGGWWMQRQQADADRRAAEAATAAAVGVDLDAASAAARAGDDAPAREALKRAEGRLGTGGPAQLCERAKQLRDDLDFAAELEEARMQELEVTTESSEWNWAAANAAYAKAFARRGLDVAGPGGTALEHIVRSPLKSQIVAALDDWACAKRMGGAVGWQGLLAAAGRADDYGNTVRRRLREAALQQDTERLKGLASGLGVADLPPADAMLLARLLLSSGEETVVAQVLRAAQGRNPGDFWLNEELGNILNRTSTGSGDEAIGFLRAAVAARPHASAAHNSLGAQLASRGKVEEAEREYREALRLRPNNPEAHNNLGTVLAGQGKAEEAEKEYRETLRLRPNDPDAHNNLGVLLKDQGKAGEADKEYREAIRIKPGYPDAHINLANLLYQQGKAAEAEKEIRQALRLKPDLPEGHYNLGNLLGKQGRVEAEKEFREAIRIKPDHPGAHLGLGIELAGRGMPAEAEREYREALRLRHDFPQAHNDLGILLYQQGKAEEAEREYREALRLRHDFPQAHTNLGALLAAQGKAAEAEKEYRETLRLRPNDPDAHNNLGNLLKDQGKAPEAENEYRGVIRIKPDYPDAHNNLGVLLASQGKVEEAEKEYREAIRLRPDFPEAHSNLGKLVKDQGKPAEADKE